MKPPSIPHGAHGEPNADFILELSRLREFTARIGRDPLLTQASTGNTSLKIDGSLWIKASGRWMSDAWREDAFVSLDLADVRHCLRRDLDPAERFPGASLETAMHAVLPHRAVAHVHSVDAIAWSVRQDAPGCFESRLEGFNWQWRPYTASGLPLAQQIERSIALDPATDVFVLGNHGLVLGANSIGALARLLDETRRRLCLPWRNAHPANYSVLAGVSAHSHWVLPDDDDLHCLATDPVSRAILAGGMLYPCQAMFRDCYAPVPLNGSELHNPSRPFVFLERHGVLLNRTAGPVEIATLSGLAHVVQRIPAGSSLRYLRETELAALSPESLYRYRDLAAASAAGK